MTGRTVFRLEQRVRVAGSGRTGIIVSLYDEPHGGGVSSARIRFPDGSNGAWPITGLELATDPEGAA